MLISIQDLTRFFGVHPNGVLHVGAHEAEEAVAYRNHKWGSVIWVEMLPEKYEALRVRFADDAHNLVLHAACWDVDGVRLSMFRASNGQSSSLLSPEHHLIEYPSVSFVEAAEIITSRLDSILPAPSRFDFINLDIQGAELHALRGLGERLAQVRWAYLEVNTLRMYRDCALVGEIDAFMDSMGFARIATRMAGRHGWGDALYVNTRKMSKLAFRWLTAKAAAWKIHNATAKRICASGS